eukprot:gnl/MRDRNA2_/MRDRNA2_127754_c0_seq1.p1 gnl/MRDRNA2_/MRDRNA2_127754_c0~~gnl/MRDRNA2_/MRDRNA2_127754_c0_seq1.p1  ORF type:complete len:437 (+),score=60.93 gnl/MRDRNA2_/MRDRNA2_127754_c0_seq1:79-1389(+)
MVSVVVTWVKLSLLIAFKFSLATSAPLEWLGSKDAVQQFTRERIEPKGAVVIFFLRSREPPKILKKLVKHKDIDIVFSAVGHSLVESEGPVGSSAPESGEGLERACIFYRGVLRRSGALVDPPSWREFRTAKDWEEKGLLDWLRVHGYPLVNVPVTTFSGPKWVQESKFGLVLVATDLLAPGAGGKHVVELLEVLRPWARLYRRKLKFSLFLCTSLTEEVCHRLGLGNVGTELIIVEDVANMPSEFSDATRAPIAKYHLTRSEVKKLGTEASIRKFFEEYEAGAVSPHYVSLDKGQRKGLIPGVKELNGNDLSWFIKKSASPEDPRSNALGARYALVLFWSSEKKESMEMDSAVDAFSRLSRLSRLSTFVALGAIDQSRNEHGLIVEALPWIRWFDRRPAQKGTPAQVEVYARSYDDLLEFVEDKQAEEQAEEGEL